MLEAILKKVVYFVKEKMLTNADIAFINILSNKNKSKIIIKLLTKV